MVDAHKERLYAVCHEYIEDECLNGRSFSVCITVEGSLLADIS